MLPPSRRRIGSPRPQDNDSVRYRVGPRPRLSRIRAATAVSGDIGDKPERLARMCGASPVPVPCCCRPGPRPAGLRRTGWDSKMKDLLPWPGVCGRAPHSPKSRTQPERSQPRPEQNRKPRIGPPQISGPLTPPTRNGIEASAPCRPRRRQPRMHEFTRRWTAERDGGGGPSLVEVRPYVEIGRISGGRGARATSHPAAGSPRRRNVLLPCRRACTNSYRQACPAA
jgi:hypothetical protein